MQKLSTASAEALFKQARAQAERDLARMRRLAYIATVGQFAVVAALGGVAAWATIRLVLWAVAP